MRRISKLFTKFRFLFVKGRVKELQVLWFKKDKESFLHSFLIGMDSPIDSPPLVTEIEDLALNASRLGELPLWEGFSDIKDYPFEVKGATRNANQVRIGKKSGDFFYSLTRAKKPEVIVEIGTAFGVSGMYWLSGLSENKSGNLLTFEPNTIWAKVADMNLSKIGNMYQLTTATFEDTHVSILDKIETIDIAFIDAIHTGEIVNQQFDLISKYIHTGSLILFDDINFSNDMRTCWKTIAASLNVRASCSIFDRIGIIEIG